MNKYMKLAFSVLLIMTVIMAQNATQNVKSAVESLRDFFCDIMPIAIVLMIAAGAVLFAVGSLLGAEQRAKTRVWAMNMFIYAGVAVLLYVLVPWLLGVIDPNHTYSCAVSSNPSPGNGGGPGTGTAPPQT